MKSTEELAAFRRAQGFSANPKADARILSAVTIEIAEHRVKQWQSQKDAP